jgi:beta-galactosidase
MQAAVTNKMMKGAGMRGKNSRAKNEGIFTPPIVAQNFSNFLGVCTLARNTLAFCVVLTLSALSSAYAGGSVGGAYSPDSAVRVVMNFNTDWLFYLGDATGANAATFNDAAWTSVCLPHTPRLETELLTGNQNYRGIHWYRRHFYLNNSFAGKKIYIEFQTGSIVTDLWVNGTAFPTHYGMNLPIIIDVTSLVTLGSTGNVIALRLNNNDNTDVPPGKVQAGSSGLDFMYFGGLYRNAHMYATDNLHITDPVYLNKTASGGIFVTYPSVSTAQATVQVKTDVKNEYTVAKTATVKTYIVDPQNTIAALLTSTLTINPDIDSQITQSATIPNPRLWYPDTPSIYMVYSSVWIDSALVDNFATHIGIRSLQWVDKALVINGRSFPKLSGTNRHQEFPYVGMAGPNSMQYRDVLKLKNGGNMWVRFSHEPANPAFLDAADSLGFMVMPCLPGWQYWNADTVFQDRCFQDLRDMVRRDRNHPCINVWESALNETSMTNAFAISCSTVVHTEYPGNQCYTSGGNWSSFVAAATIYNLYWGTGNAGNGIPILREYGDWEYGGNTSTSRVQRSDGEVKMLVGVTNRMNSANSLFGSTDNTAAMNTWTGIDYNRGYATPTCYAGLLDLFRLPKFVYNFYESQRSPTDFQAGVQSGPYVFIANWWTPASPDSVTVFSNCSQVKLYLNGTLFATQSPDVSFVSGGTTVTCLWPHPPFTFKNLPRTSGTLQADGLIGGVVVTSDTVKTPGTAVAVTVTIDTLGKPLVADGSDLVFVYASLRDANGTIVPTNGTMVTFSAAGPGTIIGTAAISANPKSTLAGIAGALLQATRTAGAITVTASAPGLTTGSASTTSIPLTDVTVPVAPTSVQRGASTLLPIKPAGVFAVHEISGGFMIDAESAARYSIQIASPAGRIVRSFSGSGTAHLFLKNGTIAKGVYIARLESAGTSRAVRFLVH